MLQHYQLPHPTQVVVQSAAEATAHAQEVGYPLIAKVDSPELAHKTDVGGVVANIETDDELQKAYNSITTNVAKLAPHATINGILLQPMLPPGNEFIIGGIRDASFGPMVMVGLGGIYAELFKDTSFRIAPIAKESSYNMLSELTSWKLLLGMRGKPQQDIDALADVIVAVATMMHNHPEIESIDLNPVLVRDTEVMVVDAKITTD
jgi:acyl-CoA synthetase (NDP forming)